MTVEVQKKWDQHLGVAAAVCGGGRGPGKPEILHFEAMISRFFESETDARFTF
jgi:hypothetical protein